MIDINSGTYLYCIFGNPVSHSLSPKMQNAAFQALNLNSVYLAFKVDYIHDAVNAMRALPIRGASITIPFKTPVMEYINEIDALAKDIGAVNTLHNVDGKIIGYNTDGLGANLSIQRCGIDVTKSNILIIGNGGSARAIAFTLLNEGASVIIAGRNEDRISSLENDLKINYKQVSRILLKDITSELMAKIDVIINTTPIGMTPQADETPIASDLITSRHTLFDIVYSPETTKFLEYGIKKGCNIIRGKEMLLYQGVKQFEIWTGKQAPVDVMRKAIAL